jgi:hypothetical protein
MRTFAQNEPLTDAELDRLGGFLESCKGGRTMNVEQLDGFFAALIVVPPTSGATTRALRLRQEIQAVLRRRAKVN